MPKSRKNKRKRKQAHGPTPKKDRVGYFNAADRREIANYIKARNIVHRAEAVLGEKAEKIFKEEASRTRKDREEGGF